MYKIGFYLGHLGDLCSAQSLGVELDSAESYAQIRKLADAAEALKILFRQNKAERASGKKIG